LNVNGVYYVGAPLNSYNTVSLTVLVNSPGGYDIKTKQINGCTFSASGTFSITGYQSVTLKGSGTPVAGGSFSFLISDDQSNCSFTINFIASIGSQTFYTDYPFATYWTDSRTQLLYTASELRSVGYTPGVITAISFNVGWSVSTQVMNGFQLKFKNTASQNLSGSWEIGTTLGVSGTYAIAGGGWQSVPLQTPFTWNGSNLLIEICYDNTTYTQNTNVHASQIDNMAQTFYSDDATGCALSQVNLMDLRPNIRFTFNNQSSTCAPLVVNHFAGAVCPENKTVTYSTVTNIPGETSKCWITRNLGASQQATSVNDATEASAGWYWQFNRKQGYKHDGASLTPNTPWIFNITENSNWISANDPCTIELGSAWRIPTTTEWTNVDNAGGWTDWNGPWNSGLALHAAGNLSTSGVLITRGVNGYLSSSIQTSTTNGTFLLFYSNLSAIANSYKSIGLSVRCVKNN
jgi:hypothetical protein